MTESYLTTDIIVIIVLVVVLVLVGIGAFLIHFYWTKIGVSEIWNTAKWSSIRSSIYRTMGRFSRANRTKFASDQPYTGPSAYKNDIDNFSSPDIVEERKKSHPVITSYVIPTEHLSESKPASTNPHHGPVSQNYATQIGQPIDDTKIYSIHEYDKKYSDPSAIVEENRF
ncbi:unnamed protein product [Rotaria magnacalcarata]|uniref:Uncharacterized protein n=1 Tax=Rotaria magnacalcarata TaxID=392030 RepID=A0A816UUC2_9BILA|nr:unnamed protein product [Rotaria magnacalcarata]CAF1375894.1 unnamed protein product [Rotaria magnacalcarata]CAF2105968.1 unnamed protein product [Rotaria magnacalcarata]CAF2129333.1 unnamed protein product [Rotaria magnacalcarata]CAF2172042.1 unnamed protein product [Rotaria magnacalcarata]